MLKFLVFADFHYQRMRFSTTVEDLDVIMERAKEENVDFVIHAGDFCGDFKNSKEITDTYLENEYNLPCYGVIGNHDLEFGNSADYVKDFLNNRPVNFATDSSYWYTDIKDYRIIGLDSNHSFNPETNEWEHDTDFNCRKGNLYSRSLSPVQVQWLDDTIADAHKKGLKVIVISHDSFADSSKAKSPDADKVREIYNKHKGTVILSMNGHYHADNCYIEDGVCYFDINSSKVGWSRYREEHHYKKEHTFPYTEYKDGKKVCSKDVSMQELDYGSSLFMYDAPLSAVVTIIDDSISIKGSKTSWMHNVLPDCDRKVSTQISDNEITLQIKKCYSKSGVHIVMNWF